MNKRQSYRQNIDLIATLHTEDTSHNILVKDMSIGGLQIQLQNTSLANEQKVILDIPMFRNIPAIIAWNRDTCHGIKFLDCPPSVGRFLESLINFDPMTEQQLA
jgi:hypothetical protein